MKKMRDAVFWLALYRISTAFFKAVHSVYLVMQINIPQSRRIPAPKRPPPWKAEPRNFEPQLWNFGYRELFYYYLRLTRRL